MRDEQREVLQDQLVDIIVRVLINNDQLHYYQVCIITCAEGWGRGDRWWYIPVHTHDHRFSKNRPKRGLSSDQNHTVEIFSLRLSMKNYP